MCMILNQALDIVAQESASMPTTDRRRLLKMLGLGAVGVAGASVLGMGAADAVPGSQSRTRLVLLGTAGGPVLLGGSRYGVSTAVVYDGKVYVVDLGAGSFQRLQQAGLSPDESLPTVLSNVRGMFFTHLHSDHVTDWPAVYSTGALNMVGRTDGPIEVFGPGRRDTLTRVFPPGRPEPAVVNPADPTPGIEGMTGYLRQAFATDFNDRIRDNNSVDPGTVFTAHDIDLTGVWTVDPEGIPPRLTEPLQIWQDGDVTVTATLVNHPPTAPAFAFRFDTPDGSVVVSGDTAVSENLIDLAQGADYLVHEVIDTVFIDNIVASLPPGIGEAIRAHLIAAHTTIEQVGRDVAQPAGVKTLVLSHLVPGNNPTSRWQKARQGFRGRLVVGSDLMQIPVGR